MGLKPIKRKYENIASWKQVQRGCFDSQVVRLDVSAWRVVRLDVSAWRVVRLDVSVREWSG